MSRTIRHDWNGKPVRDKHNNYRKFRSNSLGALYNYTMERSRDQVTGRLRADGAYKNVMRELEQDAIDENELEGDE
jgi:hypothetical protein